MKVHIASYLSAMGGSIDPEHYLRPIPNCPGWAALCKKPRYSKKAKKEMAKRAQVKAFSTMTAKAKRIYNTPELRAEWQAKYDAALKVAKKKHPHLEGNNPNQPYVPARLWDFIRQEIHKEMKG